MNEFTSIFSMIREGLEQIAFPNICLCCGQETLKRSRHICSFCLYKRFEDANPENTASSSAVILPPDVAIQHALWNFDQGGTLQDLMHHLKYNRLTSVGNQLGKVLARRIINHPGVKMSLNEQQTVLVPVPLHYLKFRKRGFNQAFHIAQGIKAILDLPICGIDAVVRQKYTRSQTGFTLQKRIDNMHEAFSVRRPKAFADKICIIVDDVFTTGATSFELARTLRAAGAASIMIWTVAQA